MTSRNCKMILVRHSSKRLCWFLILVKLCTHTTEMCHRILFANVSLIQATDSKNASCLNSRTKPTRTLWSMTLLSMVQNLWTYQPCNMSRFKVHQLEPLPRVRFTNTMGIETCSVISGQQRICPFKNPRVYMLKSNGSSQ